MTGPDLAKHAKTSYRTVDYWTRRGYITAASAGTRGNQDRDPQSPGSGAHREYSATEAEICRRMASLIRVGLRPEVAAGAAREWVLGGREAAYLGEDIVIRSEPGEQEDAA